MDNSRVLVVGSGNLVYGIEADSEWHFTLSRPQSTFIDRDKATQLVDRDIALEVTQSVGIGLESPCRCSANPRSEHSVTAYIGPYVQKQVAFSKEMKRKHHVCKLVQPSVDITSRPCHSVSNCETLPSDPREKKLFLNAAL